MPMLTTIAQLEALYGQPHERAVRKEISYINEDYRAFIEVAPFAVLATAGPEGLDCSPRGDAPGFVRIVDERTLALPDRIGNNRLDSLRNIIVEPRLALLFHHSRRRRKFARERPRPYYQRSALAGQFRRRR
jgi:predicted pyridoxine 5'-phosphate oxidase superfamily flavin-nucleotide-binding protein